MLGQAVFDDKVVKFAIDSADAPFLFDRQVLDDVDVYFKMQCPKEFPAEGFHLTNDVVIPWTDYAFVHDEPDEYVGKKPKGKRKDFIDLAQYRYKIHPLMIGPRRLARGNDFYQLRKGYENIIQSKRLKRIKMSCAILVMPRGRAGAKGLRLIRLTMTGKRTLWACIQR